MREQVPHGRSGRTRCSIEIDDALLCRNEDGNRAHRLRDRSEPHGVTRIAMGLGQAVTGDHSGRGERHRPALDPAEGLHAARY